MYEIGVLPYSDVSRSLYLALEIANILGVAPKAYGDNRFRF